MHALESLNVLTVLIVFGNSKFKFIKKHIGTPKYSVSKHSEIVGSKHSEILGFKALITKMLWNN